MMMVSGGDAMPAPRRRQACGLTDDPGTALCRGGGGGTCLTHPGMTWLEVPIGKGIIALRQICAVMSSRCVLEEVVLCDAYVVSHVYTLICV